MMAAITKTITQMIKITTARETPIVEKNLFFKAVSIAFVPCLSYSIKSNVRRNRKIFSAAFA